MFELWRKMRALDRKRGGLNVQDWNVTNLNVTEIECLQSSCVGCEELHVEDYVLDKSVRRSYETL